MNDTTTTDAYTITPMGPGFEVRNATTGAFICWRENRIQAETVIADMKRTDEKQP